MTIQLSNTLTGRKHILTPKDPGHVTLYVCGPTVYDRAHIGNFRPLIVFDTLFRLLRHAYGAEHVVYASNITDIDDKIIARALEAGESPAHIAARYEKAYLQDARALNALPPTHRPKATQFIPAMIEMMQSLQNKGAAYVCPSGLVFEVRAFAEYGRLSKRKHKDSLAGARIKPDPDKRDPADFYLWKKALPNDPDEAIWDSPWGAGRPGWHIECSAMCAKVLGPQIDIHGGGIDLCFPHHENEIAQSECAHAGPMAQIWMHNGYVRFGDEKMSKSLGNILTLPELTRSHAPETLRLALLSAHYRKPLDWNEALLADCQKRLDKLYGALEAVWDRPARPDTPECEAAIEPVRAALRDDLNTPFAVSELSRLARSGASKAALLAAGDLLGLLRMSPDAWRETHAAPPLDAGESAKIEALVQQRTTARSDKDWAKADRIREDLLKQGIEIEDTPDGSVWRRVR